MSLIVIVDDRVTNRNVFAKLAASVEPDVTVQTFGDPREALAWLAANTPDLIVTDYKMPHHDGADFVRLFRAIPGRSDIPVVVITVYEERTFRLRALEAGATDFLTSPVDHHEFITRARNLLALHTHRSRLAQATTLARALEDNERAGGRRLRQSFETLAQVVDALPALISATGPDGALLFANAAQTAFANVALDDIVGRPPSVLFGAEAGARSAAMDRLAARLDAPACHYEDSFESPDGSRVFLVSKTPLRAQDDALSGVLTSATDITEQTRIADRLRRASLHDAATDLPNGAHMRTRLRGLAHGVRRGERPFALHLLGVDDVATGDREQAMGALALRLRATIRADDELARWSERVFAIRQAGAADGADVGDCAARLRLCAAGLDVDASIGAAVCDGDEASVAAHAEAALRSARLKGGGLRIVGARATAPRDGDLRSAVRRNELALHLRPLRHPATGRLAGVEALAGWGRPRASRVDPAAFVARVDDPALSESLRAWLLREACRAAVALRAAAASVTVYLPAEAMATRDVATLTARALAAADAPADALVVEISAQSLRHDAGRAACEALRASGMGVSIDAEAAEVLALGHVSRAPLTRVRLNAGDPDDPEAASVLRRAMLHARSLDLEVVVSDAPPERAASLAAAGCDLVAAPRGAPSSTLAELLEAAARGRQEGAA